MKGTELSFVVLKPKEQVEKQGLNQTRTSCTPNAVSSYGPYLKPQRSKNYKIGVVGKKIRFSTISPEIEQVEKHGLNQTRTSCTPNAVSSYGPYLKPQRSKNYKIGVVGKKIRFSTISPEIEIFEFAHFLPQIRPAISG
jgi:predicted ester cyclase